MFSAVGANFQNSGVENTDFGNICLNGTQMLNISKNESRRNKNCTGMIKVSNFCQRRCKEILTFYLKI